MPHQHDLSGQPEGEVNFGFEDLFFSRTDRRGVILAGNDVFQRVAWSLLPDGSAAQLSIFERQTIVMSERISRNGCSGHAAAKSGENVVDAGQSRYSPSEPFSGDSARPQS